MQNNSQSPENDYILAAISYFPFVSIFTIFTSGKKNYYIKYHSSHALLFYILNLFFLVFLIFAYWNLKELFGFFINILFGFFVSMQMLIAFSTILYYASQAYQGKYIVIPIITKMFYKFFK
ncbi:MAG: hypothetical protein U0457_05660 [Candidatus Sericytochromatia bacterium]